MRPRVALACEVIATWVKRNGSHLESMEYFRAGTSWYTNQDGCVYMQEYAGLDVSDIDCFMAGFGFVRSLSLENLLPLG